MAVAPTNLSMVPIGEVIAETKKRQRAVRDCLRESVVSEPRLASYFDPSELPQTPGSGADVATSAQAQWAGKIGRRLGATGEVAVVGGLTFADLLHDAALIDPRVVAAADFSRVESLNDVFSFGSFAERVRSLGEAARAGAEKQSARVCRRGLRGGSAERP